MVKKGEIVITTVNPNHLSRFTLDPTDHFSEVDTRRYQNGKLIRSTFTQRLIDYYFFLKGQFYRDPETNEITGGHPGILDFILPHYFVYLAWNYWIKEPTRVLAGFFITIPLGLLSLLLFIAQSIVAVVLEIVSYPFIGIAHIVYLSKFHDMKQVIKSLIITKNNPIVDEENQQLHSLGENSEKKALDLFPLQEGFLYHEDYLTQYRSVSANSAYKTVKAVEEEFQNLKPHFIEDINSYKELFSDMNCLTELVEDNENQLFIKVTKENKSALNRDSNNRNNHTTFFIKVDTKNKEPIKNALYLNIFGITSSLENKKNEQNQSDLSRVEERIGLK